MTNDEKDSKGPGSSTSRLWIVWVTIFVGIIFLMFLRDRWENQGEVISQYQFEQLLDDGQITRAVLNYSPPNVALTEITGTYWKGQNDQRTAVAFRAKVRLTSRLEQRLTRLPYVEVREPNTMLFSVFWSILPIVVIAAFIWFFFIRQIKRISRGTKGVPSLEERTTKEVEQQQRFDKLLDRWEQQADRMDKILQRGEDQATQQKDRES